MKHINPLIFISYHKECPILRGSFINPIHVGRSTYNLQKERKDEKEPKGLSSCIGDDTEDNISIKNSYYCELTGIYWIWKHINKFPEVTHFGHMQYRRHFILRNEIFEAASNNKEKRAYGCVHFSKVDSSYLERIGYSLQNLSCLLNENDGILPISGDLSALKIPNLWTDYLFKIPGTHVDDLVTFVKLFREYDGEAAESFEEYLENSVKLMYQMFIISRNDFQDYCSFLFPLLFLAEKRLNFEKYSSNGKRTMGYLGELLFGWYFLNLAKTKKFLNLGVTYIEGI